MSVALGAAGISLGGFPGAAVILSEPQGPLRAAIRANELAEWLKQARIAGLSKPEDITGTDWRRKIAGRQGIVYFEGFWQEILPKMPTQNGILAIISTFGMEADWKFPVTICQLKYREIWALNNFFRRKPGAGMTSENQRRSYFGRSNDEAILDCKFVFLSGFFRAVYMGAVFEHVRWNYTAFFLPETWIM